MTEYPAPVSKLLTLGEAERRNAWPNYLELGLGMEHIPDLIRMALDEELNSASSKSDEVWAPLHAWRALAQLRAEAAIEPLLNLFRRVDQHHDDWVLEDLPDAYGVIGPAAIPALAAYLADSSHGLFARIATATALKEIGTRHPESRAAAVAALTGQLERFAQSDPSLNGSLLADLLDLDAVESAPVIERAFAAGAIDEMIAGDWEDVQVEFGLEEERTTPKSTAPFEEMMDRLAGRANTPPRPFNPQVDGVIAQMRADGVLKSAAPKAAPKAEKPKKKHKKKK